VSHIECCTLYAGSMTTSKIRSPRRPCSNDFPKPMVFRLWDWFFLEGPEMIFYVLIAYFR
jgi:hypothetical protein